MASKKPDFVVKAVVNTGKVDDKGKQLSRFTDIGVGFCNSRSESITVLLNALPIGDKILLVKPRPVEDKSEPKYDPKKGVWI